MHISTRQESLCLRLTDRLCVAAAFFVAMSYAFMYGSMGDRVLGLFTRRPKQEELPSFKKVRVQHATSVRAQVLCCCHPMVLMSRVCMQEPNGIDGPVPEHP